MALDMSKIYVIIDQFVTQIIRAIEKPKGVLTFNLCQFLCPLHKFLVI